MGRARAEIQATAFAVTTASDEMQVAKAASSFRFSLCYTKSKTRTL